MTDGPDQGATGPAAMARPLAVTQVDVRVAENALTCVATGTGMAIEDLDNIRNSGALTTL